MPAPLLAQGGALHVLDDGMSFGSLPLDGAGGSTIASLPPLAGGGGGGGDGSRPTTSDRQVGVQLPSVEPPKFSRQEFEMASQLFSLVDTDKSGLVELEGFD